MKETVNKTKNEIESFLKSNYELQDKQIDCILLNPKTDERIVYASDDVGMIRLFMPYTKEEKIGYTDIPEWAFNFDGYIFKELETHFQVGFMSDNMHNGIWQTLNDLYPEEIENKDGVQMYLQFCADNEITKEYLEKKSHLNTPDIMKNFEGLGIFEIMEYKGYIIEADDLNYDNSRENLVNIYENKTDYDKKESIENISLNTIGLKQNIKDYIDEFYINKTTIELENKNKIFNGNMLILNKGFRHKEPVALVEHIMKDSKEYIIAFNYEIIGSNLDWGYGYYYDDNKVKAEKDYKKVISGGNLAHTFDKEQER